MILNSCNLTESFSMPAGSNPWSRYHSADELMMALLSFQFNRRHSRWVSRSQSLAWAIGVFGAAIGTGFVIFLVWRWFGSCGTPNDPGKAQSRPARSQLGR